MGLEAPEQTRRRRNGIRDPAVTVLDADQLNRRQRARHDAREELVEITPPRRRQWRAVGRAYGYVFIAANGSGASSSGLDELRSISLL